MRNLAPVPILSLEEGQLSFGVKLKKVADGLGRGIFTLLLIALCQSAQAGLLPTYQGKLLKAIQTGDVAKVEKILSDKEAMKRIDFKKINKETLKKDAIFFLAVRMGDLKIVESILKVAPDLINQLGQKGATPLYIAVQEGHLEVVKALLAKDAQVNLARTDNGMTPLYVAAERGYLEVLKALLAKDAQVNLATTDDGMTPLYAAAARGHLEVVKALLAKDAQVNLATTDEGATPLFMAARNGHSEIVKELIQSGRLNLNQEINIALKFAQPALVKMLRKVQEKKAQGCKKKLIKADRGVAIFVKNIEDIENAQLKKRVQECFDSVLAKKALFQAGDHSLECPICLDCVFEKDRLISPSCSHLHCKGCYKKLLLTPPQNANGQKVRDPVCPLCRGDICNKTYLEVVQTDLEEEECPPEEIISDQKEKGTPPGTPFPASSPTRPSSHSGVAN
jgi:hypothetical protein